jgi:acetyl-CoA acetyltransferase
MSHRNAVAILGGVRIPFARHNTAYVTSSNLEMLRFTFSALVQRFGLSGERLGEVVAGAVLKHSRDFNVTRFRSGAANTVLRFAAGVCGFAAGGDWHWQQNRTRANRVGYCRRG